MFTNNPSRNRFEWNEQGYVVFADYQRQKDGRIVITHVESPLELHGTGAAGRLMEAMMKQLQAEGAIVLPLCGYAQTWIARHPQYQEMLQD